MKTQPQDLRAALKAALGYSPKASDIWVAAGLDKSAYYYRQKNGYTVEEVLVAARALGADPRITLEHMGLMEDGKISGVAVTFGEPGEVPPEAPTPEQALANVRLIIRAAATSLRDELDRLQSLELDADDAAELMVTLLDIADLADQWERTAPTLLNRFYADGSPSEALTPVNDELAVVEVLCWKLQEAAKLKQRELSALMVESYALAASHQVKETGDPDETA